MVLQAESAARMLAVRLIVEPSSYEVTNVDHRDLEVHSGVRHLQIVRGWHTYECNICDPSSGNPNNRFVSLIPRQKPRIITYRMTIKRKLHI